jgi:ABC-type branched-subunit amino acid transport system substrate-binding protein
MAPGAGITFTKLSDQWPLDQTDFSGVASKVVAACDKANADALCLMVTAPQADAFMKALKGAGLDIPVIGGPTLASAIPLFAQGTKNVNGMYFISTAVTAGPQLPDSYPGKPMIAGMYEAVMAETKAPPDTFAGWAADAVNLMAEAVTKAGGIDKTAVRDAFESITDFQGFSGVYSYSATDHVGIHGQMWLFQIKNGKYVLQGDAPVN